MKKKYKNEETPNHHLTLHCWYNPFATTAELYEIEGELIKTIKPLFNEKMPPATLKKPLAMLAPAKEGFMVNDQT